MIRLLFTLLCSAFLIAACQTGETPEENQTGGDQEEQNNQEETDEGSEEETGQEEESSETDEGNSEEETGSEEGQEEENEGDSTEESSEPSEEELLSLIAQFDGIQDELDNMVDFDSMEGQVGYPFYSITTKEEFAEEFSGFVDKEVVLEHWDRLLEEGGGKLYLIPSDGVPKFHEENGYNIEELEDGKYQLTSEHTTELSGQYEYNVTFYQASSGDWKIGALDIVYQNGE
ncbi:hypothetical protein [Gracilibacillus sp. YIM 98692]|uniref:hypothetical protein n=1 Tax=Gracilibacillus sp. YIM 98692 TaxID=2663532 RepID=UPI0013D2A1C6|nr:hypothetical protein [Gracilibacillus sp. YIM 98692]